MPDPGPRHPGDVLRVEPFPGAPADAMASRVLYASSAPDGTPIEVTALVIVPSAPPPPKGRSVLAWLHATTGVASACAPTLGPSPFTQIQGLAAFLAAGYAVVATDYPGLGGPGVHPYLVGASEARAALDSVRAVLRLVPQAKPQFAVWGHSQGGHAALFTAQLAASYAPELQLVGVAAAAPVTDLVALFEQPGRDPLWGALLSYTVWSWSRVFGLDPDSIVPSATRATIAATADDCLESGAELQRLEADAAPMQGQPVVPQQSWRGLLQENAPQPWATGVAPQPWATGVAPQPWATRVPVFLAQGDEDPVIVPELTRRFASRLCRERVPLRYLAMPGVDHFTAGMRSAGAAATWIADRFAVIPPPDDCGKLPRS